MSQSLLRRKKPKSSVGRHYRVGISPYDATKPARLSGAQSTLLLSASKSLSERTMDRNTKAVRKEYEGLKQSYTRDQRQDLQVVRQEIGWEDMDDRDRQWQVQNELQSDEDSDGEWVDEIDGNFHAFSVPVARQGAYAQSWTERLAKERLAWEKEMTQLCEAFLAFNRAGSPQIEHSSASASTSASFSILCVCLTEKSQRIFSPGGADESVAVTLMRRGFIPPTPSSPSCAIHVDVLRYCAALRRNASSISLQGIAASICEIHNTVYARHFRTQLSAALDVYLALIRMVDLRVARVLGRDDPDWRLANACAACTYRLHEEPPLKYSVMLTCDGNDSLKRVANASVVDRRVLNHSYFLDSDYVDGFENEVAGGRKAKSLAINRTSPLNNVNDIPESNHAIPENSIASPELSLNDDQGDQGSNDNPRDGSSEKVPEDCEPQVIACESRWKNAQVDGTAKKVVVFDETGIFAVSCRHGSVMFVEDMRRSGELSKYGLAAVDKLCRVLGKDILIGYDIGCTFRGTAQRSPLVGPLVREHNISFCVGSFHGYAHNRKCQLGNHPLNLEGAGTESFEECETLFSSTNSVALTTRHASPFHRRQHIVLHLGGWDLGRRCALGSVLKSKYTHALRTLNTLPQEIEKLSPGKTDQHWRAMFQAEVDYFESLKTPSPENNFAVLYVKRLRVLLEKQAAHEKVFSVKITYTLPSQIDNYRNHPDVRGTVKENQYQHSFATQTRKLEAQRTAATEQLLAIQTEVARLEQERGISSRWTPGCEEWEAAIKRESLDDYHEALRSLETLVVQRIAELDKSHSAGTGYKVRTQMAKALNRRERAVHTALARYNAAAISVGRETLTFKELSDHAYLANFDFLKYSEHGAQEAEWSRPFNRRCVEAWQRIERAKEEVVRLNIEIRRVKTHMRDEEEFLSRRYDSIKTSSPDLAHALLRFMELTVRVNQRICRDLEAISKLQGFTGDLGIGQALTPLPSLSEQPHLCMNETAARPEITDKLGDIHEGQLTGTEETIDVEPTDEARQAMVAIEESCIIV